VGAVHHKLRQTTSGGSEANRVHPGSWPPSRRDALDQSGPPKWTSFSPPLTRHLEENLERLAQSLREGSYRPQAIRREWIPKPGSEEKRPLGIPTVRDRVVQAALLNVLEPIFERDFAEQSYGFRPKRGCKDALRRVMELLRCGHGWVVDADLKSYFDTIPHDLLVKRVEEKVSDGAVITLVEGYLKQEVMEAMKQWTPEGGTPQGAVVSPLLSNIYLDPLDHEMAGRGIEMVRYADDCAPRRRGKEAVMAA
jgi:RNA-directed DNA polymerase